MEEKPDPKPAPLTMKPTQWIIATTVAATTMISYIHNFVYTRTEGEKLETRVTRVADRTIKLLEETNRKIERLDDKLDKVIWERNENKKPSTALNKTHDKNDS